MVNLPTNLTEIEDEAFSGCENLEGPVNWPLGFEKLGKKVFVGCDKLKETGQVSDSE